MALPLEVMRYKVWRNNKDERLHLLYLEGGKLSRLCPPLFEAWVQGLEARRVRSIGYVSRFV
jgi:hypothetical protein